MLHKQSEVFGYLANSVWKLTSDPIKAFLSMHFAILKTSVNNKYNSLPKHEATTQPLFSREIRTKLNNYK